MAPKAEKEKAVKKETKQGKPDPKKGAPKPAAKPKKEEIVKKDEHRRKKLPGSGKEGEKLVAALKAIKHEIAAAKSKRKQSKRPLCQLKRKLRPKEATTHLEKKTIKSFKFAEYRKKFGVYVDKEALVTTFKSHPDPKAFVQRNLYMYGNFADRIRVGRKFFLRVIRKHKPHPKCVTETRTGLNKLKTDATFKEWVEKVCKCKLEEVCDKTLSYICAVLRNRLQGGRRLKNLVQGKLKARPKKAATPKKTVTTTGKPVQKKKVPTKRFLQRKKRQEKLAKLKATIKAVAEGKKSGKKSAKKAKDKTKKRPAKTGKAVPRSERKSKPAEKKARKEKRKQKLKEKNAAKSAANKAKKEQRKAKGKLPKKLA